MRPWLLSLALVIAAACDPEDPPPEPFFPEDFAASYTEVRACRFSVEHDGANIAVYASPNAAAAYRDGIYPLPEGAIIVKREHRDSQCTDVTGFTAMKKVGGEWTWQRSAADRTVDTTAEASRCIACHASCTNNRDLTCTDP